MNDDLTIDKIMDFAFETVKKIIEVRQEEAHNMLIAETIDQKPLLVPLMWANEMERAITLNFVRQKFKELKVIRYVHVSEVWTSSNMELHEAGVRPMEDPDRGEAVMVMGVNMKEVKHRSWPIINNPDGTRKLGPEKTIPYSSIGGSMTTLMGERQPLN